MLRQWKKERKERKKSYHEITTKIQNSPTYKNVNTDV